MDKKRDYIKEIVAKRSRLSSIDTRLSHFATRTAPIDYGARFLANKATKAKGFQDFKFQIETVLAITAKRASVGEFIAHLLPIRNLRDINSAMSVLIGEDFLERLKRTKLSVVGGSKQETLEQHYESNVFAAVEDAFLLRHMFCHEFATAEQIDQDRLWNSTRG